MKKTFILLYMVFLLISCVKQPSEKINFLELSTSTLGEVIDVLGNEFEGPKEIEGSLYIEYKNKYSVHVEGYPEYVLDYSKNVTSLTIMDNSRCLQGN